MNELSFLGVLFLFGGVVFLLHPRLPLFPKIEESKISTRFLSIIFRILGFIIASACVASGNFSIGSIIMTIFGLLMLVFSKTFVSIFYQPGSKENIIFIRVFSIGLIVSGIFVILVSLHPSRFPTKQEGRGIFEWARNPWRVWSQEK